MIDPLGGSAALVAFFVGFGLVVGVLFGFFGMGGSFLVTPTLLAIGYPARVAVGSGMAFVFGTAVIATLKHRDLGQVDYRIGAVMVVGTTAGIEVGRQLVFRLEALGLAERMIAAAYVVLLAAVGAVVTRDARGDGGDDAVDGSDAVATTGPDDLPELADRLQRVRVPPMLDVPGGARVSLWLVVAVAFVTGVLSGFLGVGGGFLRLPALLYAFGMPAPVAVGTDLFEITLSSAVGSYLYAEAGGVDLAVVAPLLFGSALGARVGSAATTVVEESAVKSYFGLTLLTGSVAVALREVAGVVGVPRLEIVSLVLLVGAAVVVAGIVLGTGWRELRADGRPAVGDDGSG